MQIVVLANQELREELIHSGVHSEANLIWINKVQDFLRYQEGNAFIDLLFENNEERLKVLRQLLPKPVVINSVAYTLKETHPSFIRINGWPGFLSTSLIEAAGPEELKYEAEQIMLLLNKKPEWLSDEPGFVSARIISMIINEAFLSLEEGVSTKEEIDTAMKLGTN